MTKTPTETDTQRRNGKVLAEQPYSVDPKASPGKDPQASPKLGSAGPKRAQKQTGQGLDNPQDVSDQDRD